MRITIPEVQLRAQKSKIAENGTVTHYPADDGEGAVKKGEEAATRLLMPMFMLLIVVMIIVMVPAVISFQV